MTTAVVGRGAATEVATLQAAVDGLANVPLSSLSDADLLDTVRQVEAARRALEAFDHGAIAEIETRNLSGRASMRNTKLFLASVLNLSGGEASRRVEHARALGPRIALTGQPLPPVRPLTAQARADGLITAEHASVVLRTLDKIPASFSVDEVSAAERILVDNATIFDAKLLAGIAKQLLDTINPDGALTDDTDQARRRRLGIGDRGDGMGWISGELDDETTALAQAVLHSLAAPRPTDAAGRDDRNPGQRLHDAFRSLLKLALRSGELPTSGGVPATVLITMTAEQFETKTGLAATSFGQKLRVDHALRIADEASIAWIVHNSAGGVLNYGHTQRLATAKQTLALIARDKGCAFPGCTDPPEWTEKHHVIPWAQSHRTRVAELCLLCDYHHHKFEAQGWTIDMRDGIPWFTPPASIDPAQTARRNTRP